MKSAARSPRGIFLTYALARSAARNIRFNVRLTIEAALRREENFVGDETIGLVLSCSLCRAIVED
jgi:hypothetical protein